jgi:alkylation response protein AidB-like acyl-CoA dehydrogenase
MDRSWTPEEKSFRDEVRAFLDAELTPELRESGRWQTSVYADHEAAMEWQRILHARSWAAPHWPVEYGGCDWSVAQHYIFRSELARADAPNLSPMGIHMVAHVIIGFGTPEQKAFFLPRILTGEVFFCQGYSEPNAGSDLASLQMAARAERDDFILNGSKIWTTHASEANWIFCLVRTSRDGPNQQGITFLLAEMNTPGIDVRPLVMSSGEVVQNQVFFTDVRVPQKNVIGTVGDGWSVAKYLLEFERGGSYAPALLVRLDRLHAQANANGREACPILATRIAELRARIEVLEMLELRLVSSTSEGRGIGAMASMIKVLGTELAQRVVEIGLDVSGPEALAYQPHAVAPGGDVPSHVAPQDGYVTGSQHDALAPLRYMNERAGSIYAGSNEIQRNILAKILLR